MMIARVEILVEEPSMEEALRLLVPKIIGTNLPFDIHQYQSKEGLLKKLPSRLKGYKSWLPEDWRIVVIVDRDDDQCKELKRKLDKIAQDVGLRTRTQHGSLPIQVVNRIAIEELEAWFFGDWDAVRAAYPKVNSNVPEKIAYRDPDGIAGGTWEALERVLQTAGYFRTGLRKIEAAQEIAQYMEPGRNRSRSFQIFRDALTEMMP